MSAKRFAWYAWVVNNNATYSVTGTIPCINSNEIIFNGISLKNIYQIMTGSKRVRTKQTTVPEVVC